MRFGFLVRVIKEQIFAPMFMREESRKALTEKEVCQILKILTCFISVNMP